MTLFNNTKLPYLEAQLLQKKLVMQPDRLHKDPEEDKLLCIAYQAGDETAFVKLFERYLDDLSHIYRNPARVRGFNMTVSVKDKTTKEDRQDLFQEICYHFAKLMEEFNPEVQVFQALVQGKLHLRVFKYYYAEFIDNRINERRLPEDFDVEEAIKDIFLLEEKQELSDDLKRLFSAFNELTEKQRTVLTYTVLKGLSSVATAEELNMTNTAVRKAKSVSIKKLKSFMNEAA